MAIVSLLFNWPSTGGGTVHTKELAEFLERDGYGVRHYFAVFAPWNIGQIREDLSACHVPVAFGEDEWHPAIIRERFRHAVNEFEPDAVIVTDSWNTKVILAEAVCDHPYYIRIAAQECLCALNNVRLLPGPAGPICCPRNQLAQPRDCRTCVATYGETMSGALHQADRELAGFMSSDYALRLREVFRRAEGVLVINPQIAHQVEPYARAVHVIPSGFDRNRFPESLAVPPAADRPRKRIMFAGLIDEYMKGFSVLQEAGERLWQTRQDFEIWVTADERQDSSEFLRYIGWQSQHQLPERIAECDILAFPTFAEEALGRTAVEAMGCGRPVVASRLGGLPWVVEDGRTGLLCEPGDPVDLANKLMQLLDDPILRRTLGTAGREKFLREFTWEQMIAHRYRPLLGDPQTAASPTDSRHSPQLAD